MSAPKIVISHRGNLFGPRSASGGENSTNAIRIALQKGFDVEIDVWLKDDLLFLGHDSPEHLLSSDLLEELTQNKKHIWWHAKNSAALAWALQHDLHVFSHDVDDYVLTSNCVLWRYPRSLHALDLCQSSARHPVVVVMPERVLDLCRCTSCLTRLSSAHVCTDYPVFFDNVRESLTSSSAKKLGPELWAHCQELDAVYASICRRKQPSTGVVFDKEIIRRDDNDLKCVAICSPLTPLVDWPFDVLVRRIFQTTQGVSYRPRSEAANGQAFSPKEALFHLTWLQLVSFGNVAAFGPVPPAEFEVARRAANQSFSEPEAQQFIIFTQCLRLPQTLALVGYSSWNMERWRQTLRSQKPVHPRFSEPYANELVHATLFRFAEAPCEEEIQEFLEQAGRCLPLRCLVAENKVVEGTWKMLSF